MGKKSGQKAAGRAAQAQTDIAQQLLGEAAPVRQGLLSRSEDFLGGGMNVTDSPSFLAFKDATGDQFSRARDNVIAATPAGGALTEALTGLEGQKASALTQGAGSIYESELGRALQLGTGITGMGQQGMASAAQTQAARAAAEAQQNAGKAGAIGAGLGGLMGGK